MGSGLRPGGGKEGTEGIPGAPAGEGGGYGFLAPLLLLLLVAAVYRPVSGYGFISMDDDRYVYRNGVVSAGLTAKGVAWAFSSVHESAYIPLTWLSHMADASLFGVSAGAMHVVNVLLHAGNVVLLFLLLRKTTGSPWRSGLAAALFAVHPLNVETVAWVSERKELLSTFFWLLALHAYRRHATAPSASRMLPVVLLHACALASKSMSVMLPATLLLLDFWPLRRLAAQGGGGAPAPPADGGASVLPAPLSRLLLEKSPLFALSAASAAVTLLGKGEGITADPRSAPEFGQRLANAAIVPFRYLANAAWPSSLSIYHPHPSTLGDPYPAWLAILSLAALAAATFLAVRRFRERPYLSFGWLWFLVTLLPVSGLVQIGVHAMADRYAYVPLAGIFVAAAWLLPSGAAIPLPERLRFPGAASPRSVPAAAFLSVIAAAALAVTAHLQVRVWKDDVSLYGQAVRVEPKGWIAWNNLGAAWSERGEYEKAEAAFRYVLSVQPGFTNAMMGLGRALAMQGREEEAARQFRSLVYLSPGSVDGWHNLAVASFRTGRGEEAREALRRLAELDAARAERLGRMISAGSGGGEGGGSPPGRGENYPGEAPGD